MKHLRGEIRIEEFFVSHQITLGLEFCNLPLLLTQFVQMPKWIIFSILKSNCNILKILTCLHHSNWHKSVRILPTQTIDTLNHKVHFYQPEANSSNSKWVRPCTPPLSWAKNRKTCAPKMLCSPLDSLIFSKYSYFCSWSTEKYCGFVICQRSLKVEIS